MSPAAVLQPSTNVPPDCTLAVSRVLLRSFPARKVCLKLERPGSWPCQPLTLQEISKSLTLNYTCGGHTPIWGVRGWVDQVWCSGASSASPHGLWHLRACPCTYTSSVCRSYWRYSQLVSVLWRSECDAAKCVTCSVLSAVWTSRNSTPSEGHEESLLYFLQIIFKFGFSQLGF